MMHRKRIQIGADIVMSFANNSNQVRRKILSTQTLSCARQTQGRSEQCLYQNARFRADTIHCQQRCHRYFSSEDNTESEIQPRTTETVLMKKYTRFVLLSANVEKKLRASILRYNEIMEEMKSGKIVSHGMQQELSSLSEAYKNYQQHSALDDEMRSYIKLMEEVQRQYFMVADALTEESKEFLEDCDAELIRIYNEKMKCEENLIDAILPKDIEDTTYDAIIEIRAGTGGDEASLFARELWDCYMKSIKTISKQWKVDILTETTTDLGGLKDGSLLISGNTISIQFDSPNMIVKDDSNDKTKENGGNHTSTKLTTDEVGPYGFFKFESGVHRVQRIPVNATRIHTSACSIAVLPSIKDDTVDKNDLLPMSELKIETMRAHGAGGQHINTTDSAVRITHLPTGIQAAIQDERSQHKNKAKALKLITARVRDLKRIEQEQLLGLQRSQLMGGGDRSERIRTYNYPQDRITDHRCKMMRREELLQQLED